MITRRKGALTPTSFVGGKWHHSYRETTAWLLLSSLHLLLLTKLPNLRSRSSPRHSALTWNGGHPPISHGANCWCAGDDHVEFSFLGGDGIAPTKLSPRCSCSPSLAIDAILTSGPDHIWLVERKDTGQYACMGGFIEVNESGEEATLRELEEETGIALSREEASPKFFGVYSDPRRDNRRPTSSIIYVLDIPLSYKPKAGDDAKGVKRVAISDINQLDFFADHLSILLDYRESIERRVAVDAGGTKKGLCI